MTQLLQRQAQTIYHAITQRQNENRENTPILIAIDGRCASGKTTLAAMVQKLYGSKNCDVLHMDDFFFAPINVRAVDCSNRVGTLTWNDFGMKYSVLQ